MAGDTPQKGEQMSGHEAKNVLWHFCDDLALWQPVVRDGYMWACDVACAARIPTTDPDTRGELIAPGEKAMRHIQRLPWELFNDVATWKPLPTSGAYEMNIETCPRRACVKVQVDGPWFSADRLMEMHLLFTSPVYAVRGNAIFVTDQNGFQLILLRFKNAEDGDIRRIAVEDVCGKQGD